MFPSKCLCHCLLLYQLFCSLCQEWHSNSNTRNINTIWINISNKNMLTFLHLLYLLYIFQNTNDCTQKAHCCIYTTLCMIIQKHRAGCVFVFGRVQNAQRHSPKKAHTWADSSIAHTTLPNISTLPGVCQRHANFYPSVTLGTWEGAVHLRAEQSEFCKSGENCRCVLFNERTIQKNLNYSNEYFSSWCKQEVAGN